MIDAGCSRSQKDALDPWKGPVFIGSTSQLLHLNVGTDSEGVLGFSELRLRNAAPVHGRTFVSRIMNCSKNRRYGSAAKATKIMGENTFVKKNVVN